MSSNTKKPPQSARTQGAYSKSFSKNDTILNALAEGSLTRFDAEQLGDHCLPSTISASHRMLGYLLALPHTSNGIWTLVQVDI